MKISRNWASQHLLGQGLHGTIEEIWGFGEGFVFEVIWWKSVMVEVYNGAIFLKSCSISRDNSKSR